MVNLPTIATITASVALAISGWFASSIASTNNRVNVVETAEAATNQKTVDIDARLTRIENKLDALIQTKQAIR